MIDNAAFESVYHHSPTLSVRAPGRVDLIGSHTDYNGLPVCACAVSRGVDVFLRPRDDNTIHLANADSRFDTDSFALTTDVPHSPQGSWINYVKAGAQGIVQHFDKHGSPWRGFDALVGGDLPHGAGLSSSSALVVAAALSTLAANDLELPHDELADLLAAAERYVGTQGGGMDQATILLSERDSALKIDFFPLRFERAAMPPNWRLAICHSLVRAEKTKEAMDRYNQRVVECALGLEIIRNSMKTDPRIANAKRLGDLAAGGIEDLEQFLGMTEFFLTQDSYSLDLAARALATDTETLANERCRRRDGSLLPEPPDGFRLRQRVQHVLGEALRVEQAADALKAGDADTVGRAMDGSYESARDLYEIATPEIDRLIGAMKKAGAKGARLAGAGFGGCCVGLVMADDIESFRATLRDAFYTDDAIAKWAEDEPVAPTFDDLCFTVRAEAGARVVDA
jgi:galactokinase